MHTPSIDILWLTNNELQVAREQVEKIAYFKWKQAGSPENSALKFWNEAELEWIEYLYVPDRGGWHADPSTGLQVAHGTE